MTTLLSAIGGVWKQGALPIGTGANVHQMLIPEPMLRPLFNWVRFDLSNGAAVATIQKAQAFYSSIGFRIVWVGGGLDGLKQLVKAGIRNACWEPYNEPNLAISGHEATMPALYVAALKAIFQYRGRYAPTITILGLGVSSWKYLAWVLQCVALGVLDYCDAVCTHAYDLIGSEVLRTNIHMQREAWGGKPFLYSEFGLLPEEFAAYPLGMDARLHTVSDTIVVAMQERIPFCLYDLPFGDENYALLDLAGRKTPFYLALEGLTMNTAASLASAPS